MVLSEAYIEVYGASNFHFVTCTSAQIKLKKNLLHLIYYKITWFLQVRADTIISNMRNDLQ